MSDTRPSKDNHVQPSDTPAPASGAMQKAKNTVETARDLLARAHQALDTKRQLIQSKQEILHYNQARRERQAEQTPSHALTVPHGVSITILLITDSPGDIARFHFALQEHALPCTMKVLTERSAVEAFVHQAATVAPLFLPRLILTDGLMPGMEAEEIVFALRSVPAYQRIPNLLFSTMEEAEGQRRYIQCGATAFVHKPRNREALGSVVATMAHRWGGGGKSAPEASQPIPPEG